MCVAPANAILAGLTLPYYRLMQICAKILTIVRDEADQS